MKSTKFLFTLFLLIAGLSTAVAEERIINDMVLISSGTFTMGSPLTELGRHDYEGPQRQVTLSSFYISRFPVTQADYQEVMGRNPSRYQNINHPVENVNWFAAIEYCNTRSIKEGFTPVYTIEENNVTWDRKANGYRLLTEAEWEYACRAGTVTPFYSGRGMDDAGWHGGNSWHPENRRRQPHPVGGKRPNNWGIHDMHGNILEWCWDFWQDSYRDAGLTDPIGPPTGDNRNRRVYRGGSWYNESNLARSAYRFGGNPRLHLDFVGFRLARNASSD